MKAPIGLIANFLSLTVILFTYQNTGSNPHVIVYAFIFLIYIRFLSIEIIQGLHRRGRPKWVRNFVRKIISSPRDGQMPIKLVEKNTEKTLSAWHYFFVLTFLLVMYFVFMTAYGIDRLEFTAAWFGNVFKWSLIYAGVYWIQDLWGKNIIVDFKKSRETNLGYNMGPVIVLIVTLYGVGAIDWVSNHFNFNLKSPWIICSLLLLVKHGMDFFPGWQMEDPSKPSHDKMIRI